ncbi:MAG TPA: DEAD/DEAH box helicase [Candidatus Acidoferrales bacterium]|nr:DEAD/DEAH box helicase [Candidatus Acidoferrales bacterium]
MVSTTARGATADRFSPSALDALVATIEQFSITTRVRGKHYAAAERVGPLAFDGACVTATVRGTELYETLWEWDGRSWEPDCTCPVAPYCKHAYALACRLVSESTGYVAAGGARLQHVLPPGMSPEAPVQVPRAPSGRSSALERLRSAREVWTRQQYFGQLVEPAVRRGLNPYLPPFPEILQESDADLLCWRLADALAARADGWLPPALEPFRNRPDLAAHAAQQSRLALARELVQWAAQQRRSAQRHLRLVFGLAREGGGRIGVTVEARLTTPRMNDESRTITQLHTLRNELHRSPGILPPDQAALLEWLTDSGSAGADPYYTTTRRLTGTGLKALLARVAESPLATWATDVVPELAALSGVVPGERVRMCATAARLLPTCVSRDGTLWVDLVFLWPDGRQRRLDDVLYLRGRDEWSRRHPSFVLADGEFSLLLEEPPEPLLERFHEAGGLPLPPAERAHVVGLLAANFPHLQETLAAHTRVRAVQPLIALDLRDDDWLQIRLFACTGEAPWKPGTEVPDGAIVFEYAPERRWVRDAPASVADAAYAGITDPPQAASGEGQASTTRDLTTRSDGAANPDGDTWLDAPQPEQVQPGIDWLDALQAGPGTKKGPTARQTRAFDRAVGWWMQASRKRMELLAEAWERRPEGVTFFGTERIRRLLAGEERVTPVLHIESSGVDWFAVSTEWQAEGLQLSDADLAALRGATARFVKLASGWVRRDVAALHDGTAQVLADLGIEAGRGEQRLTLWQLAGARPESLQALERFGADADTLRAVHRLRERVARFDGLPRVALPTGLRAELRSYQRLGLDFLAYASSLGIGAVLADDMGLGKTVQALAWLAHLREQEPDGGPSLVVCPASVVHNWAREAARFTPNLRVLLLTSGQTRHALRREIPAHDLIVTNYALLRRDLEAWRAVQLRAAILDEAQNIKNPDAAVTHAAAALQARYRLALTGTPLENRALDLWSIVQCVNPGYLGGRGQFQNRFDRLDAPPHVRTLLAAKLRPVLLRRTKQEVATDLPERIEERLDCELIKEQRQLYLAELRRSRALVEELSGAPGGITQNKIHILAALTRLRQICCHPALAGGKAGLGSGKFEALFELLEPLLAEGHKVLLFSQFVECLKLLKKEMAARDIAHHVLTGQTTKRKEVVDAFQSDPRPCVFLISLKAGGTGLNLTAASYVVLFDPWWNPAVEAQAIDRTHRIGQDRTVIAYRMLTSGTIEEKIWELQQRKAALARDILGEGGFARALTRSDLDYLLAET